MPPPGRRSGENSGALFQRDWPRIKALLSAVVRTRGDNCRCATVVGVESRQAPRVPKLAGVITGQCGGQAALSDVVVG